MTRPLLLGLDASDSQAHLNVGTPAKATHLLTYL